MPGTCTVEAKMAPGEVSGYAVEIRRGAKKLEAHTVGAKNGNTEGWGVGRENLRKGLDWLRVPEMLSSM